MRSLSWLSAHYGDVVEVVSMVIKEGEHAGKHLGVLRLETVSNNPQSSDSALIGNKYCRIHKRHLADHSFWAEPC